VDELLTLEILTPSGPLLTVEAGEELRVPGVEVPGLLGELGVLPSHIPFVSPVRPGVVRFKVGDTSHRVAVGQGFVEISNVGRVSILVDRAERGADVDVAQATADAQAAEEELAGLKDAIDDAEHTVARERLGWHQARVRAAEGS